jgi:hypothetical protein
MVAQVQTEYNPGMRLLPQNMVPLMLRSSEHWTAINQFINEIMKTKESEEKRRQAN